MAFLTLKTSYIAAGETFRLIITDPEGTLGDTLPYTLSAPGLNFTSHFVGEDSLSGIVTLGTNDGRSGFKDFVTTADMPTGEEFMTLTVSSPGMNDIYLNVYSVNHYLTPKTKIELGDTFDVWRKKTNGFIARLDTIEDSTSEIKSQTIIGDGVNNEFTLNFPIVSVDTHLYVVHIDGIAQNPDIAYTISNLNNSIVFSEIPISDSSISVIHRYEVSKIARDTVSTWGSITGTLSNQTDLISVLSDKVSVTSLQPLSIETYDLSGGAGVNVVGANNTGDSFSIVSAGSGLTVTTADDIITLDAQVTTISDITSDVDVGGISKTDIVPSGTSLQEFITQMLSQTYYPTFVLPSVNLTDNIAATVEVGTLGLTLTANYNAGAINGDISGGIWDPNLKQADRADVATQYTFRGTTIASSPVTQAGNSLALPTTTIEEGVNTFNVVTDYDSGPQPLDSLGAAFDSPLPSGDVSDELTVNGRRNAFYGVDLASIDSAGVRALTSKLNPSNGTSFTINIPAGATDVVFAYPATLRDVDSVIYVEGLNAETKTAFSQQTVNVEGANSYTAIGYKLYTFTPANPFGATATYIVTI